MASSMCHAVEGASKAGAPPPKAVAKVASLSKLAFGAPEDYLALDAAPTDERHSMTFVPSLQLSLQPVGTSDQRRREDLEEFDRFANARLEDLAGDILNLCKDRQLDDIYLKIDALQQYIKFLATPPIPVVTDDPNLWTRGDSSSKSTVHPVSKPVDSQHEGPDEPLIATDKNPYSLYGLPALSEPVKPSTIAPNPPSRITPTFPGAYFGEDVTLEGMDNIVRVSDFGTDPAKAPLVIKNVRSSSTTATSGSDHGAGVILEGMDDIVWVSDRTAGSSAERSVAMPNC
ncbi:hypothetical protein BJV77DRAFT_7695 [Russula vinacea]|nr:hypothetical protein BJV77DRAFT_7695 [Russula vinacea]